MEIRLEEVDDLNEEKSSLVGWPSSRRSSVHLLFLFSSSPCWSISPTHHSCADIARRSTSTSRWRGRKWTEWERARRGYEWILRLASHYSISIGQMSRVKNEFWSMNEWMTDWTSEPSRAARERRTDSESRAPSLEDKNGSVCLLFFSSRYRSFVRSCVRVKPSVRMRKTNLFFFYLDRRHPSTLVSFSLSLSFFDNCRC